MGLLAKRRDGGFLLKGEMSASVINWKNERHVHSYSSSLGGILASCIKLL